MAGGGRSKVNTTRCQQISRASGTFPWTLLWSTRCSYVGGCHEPDTDNRWDPRTLPRPKNNGHG